MSEPGAVWYVSYGSNLLPQGVAQYLRGETDTRAASLEDLDATDLDEGQPVTFAHPLYFAGVSKTWGGGVAFVDTYAQSGHTTYGRGERLTVSELATIISKENGEQVELCLQDLREVAVGAVFRLPVALDEAGYRGKYNALLRLEDIRGEQAFTLTTVWDLSPNAPAPGYLERIRFALDTRLSRSDVTSYLAAAMAYRANSANSVADKFDK